MMAKTIQLLFLACRLGPDLRFSARCQKFIHGSVRIHRGASFRWISEAAERATSAEDGGETPYARSLATAPISRGVSRLWVGRVKRCRASFREPSNRSAVGVIRPAAVGNSASGRGYPRATP